MRQKCQKQTELQGSGRSNNQKVLSQTSTKRTNESGSTAHHYSRWSLDPTKSTQTTMLWKVSVV
eukprot:6875802-Heterocapsa_arctica.AAC.1